MLTHAPASQLPPRLPVPVPQFDPDLVLAYVTVTAPKNATAPRLAANRFHIQEDGVEQKIDYFSVQDQPVSVGVVWGGGTGFEDPAPDPDVRECPRAFMKNSGPGAEYFILAGDTVLTSFTTNLDKIPLIFALSSSSTDNVHIGLDVLKESASSRKILLVVAKPSGGGGGLLESDYVERVAIRQGVQIHIVSFFSGGDTAVNNEGSIFFSELSDLTGGSYFMGPPSTVLCANLAKELRVQYLIGYHPTNDAKDGKWRKLSVSVDSPEASQKLKARIKRGYYAEKNETAPTRKKS